MLEAVYKDGTMVPENGVDNTDLYPRYPLCPRCDFNLVRHKMKLDLPWDTWLEKCPYCKTDLHGW